MCVAAVPAAIQRRQGREDAIVQEPRDLREFLKSNRLKSFIGSFDFRPAIMTLGKTHLARRRQLCGPLILIQGYGIHY
jgi:hypothetical protein